MRAHVDDGALEARIAHDRHGDQQPAVQIALTGRIVAKAGGFAANGLRCLAFRAHPQRPLLLSHILISVEVSVNQASGIIRRPITRNSMVCAATSL
jgi:hypothetical protein